jgi:hypothetical protein
MAAELGPPPPPPPAYDAWGESRRSVVLLLGIMTAWLLPLTALRLAYAAWRKRRGTAEEDAGGGGGGAPRHRHRAAAADGDARPPQFRFAVSRLDTHGNLVTIWAPEPAPLRAAAEAGDVTGVLNLVVVATAAWVVTNGLLSLRAAGTWWPDAGAWLAHTFGGVGSLAGHVGGLWALYAGVAYPLVVAGATGALPAGGAPARLLQVAGEAVLLLAPCAYLRTRPDWPWTQRLFYAMETVVLTLKAHSYIEGNRRLDAEARAGGPASGLAGGAAVAAAAQLDAAIAHATAAGGGSSGSGGGGLGGSRLSFGGGDTTGDEEEGTQARLRRLRALRLARNAAATGAAPCVGAHCADVAVCRSAGLLQLGAAAVPDASSAAVSTGRGRQGPPPAAAAAATSPTSPTQPRRQPSRRASSADGCGGSSGTAAAAAAAAATTTTTTTTTPAALLRAAAATLSRLMVAEPARDFGCVDAQAAAARADAVRRLGLSRPVVDPDEPAAGSASASEDDDSSGDGRRSRRSAPPGGDTPAGVGGLPPPSPRLVLLPPADGETGGTPPVTRPAVTLPVPAAGDAARRPHKTSPSSGADDGGGRGGGGRHHGHGHHARGAVAGAWWQRLVWGLNTEGQPVATGSAAYPFTVSLADFAFFSFAPTLVYEPNPPRTTGVRWAYVGEKVALAGGAIIVGSQVMTQHVLPAIAASDPARHRCAEAVAAAAAAAVATGGAAAGSLASPAGLLSGALSAASSLLLSASAAQPAAAAAAVLPRYVEPILMWEEVALLLLPCLAMCMVRVLGVGGERGSVGLRRARPSAAEPRSHPAIVPTRATCPPILPCADSLRRSSSTSSLS